MKALVGAFNQEKALVGAFSVIIQPVVEPMDRFTALVTSNVVTACAGQGEGAGPAVGAAGAAGAAGDEGECLLPLPAHHRGQVVPRAQPQRAQPRPHRRDLHKVGIL